MAGVQRMRLTSHEQAAVRRYLLNGGFIMMDDFWSPEGWANVLAEMRGVFPDREPEEQSPRSSKDVGNALLGFR